MLWVVSPPLELCKETMTQANDFSFWLNRSLSSHPHMHHIVPFNHSLGDKFCPQKQSEFFHFHETAGESKSVFFVKFPVLVLQFLKCLLYSEERLRHSREPAQTQARYPTVSPSGRQKRGELGRRVPTTSRGARRSSSLDIRCRPAAGGLSTEATPRPWAPPPAYRPGSACSQSVAAVPAIRNTRLVFKALRKRKRTIHRR